jgi:hypothetical protein
VDSSRLASIAVSHLAAGKTGNAEASGGWAWGALSGFVRICSSNGVSSPDNESLSRLCSRSSSEPGCVPDYRVSPVRGIRSGRAPGETAVACTCGK